MMDGYFHNKEGTAAGAPVQARYSMAGTPPGYKNDIPQNKKEDKGGFARIIKKIFLQWDLREIERELQTLKLSKIDMVESAFQKSEIEYISLILKMFSPIFISMLIIFLSFLIFLFASNISLYFAILVTFLFLQLFLYPNSKIVYSLHKHQIGSKETGRYIKYVRNMWHGFEILLLSFVLFLFYMVNFVDYREKIELLAQKLLGFEIKIPMLSFLYKKILSLVNIKNWEYLPEYYLSSLLFFIFTYLIANYIIYKKAHKEAEIAKFNLLKEFKTPAEIIKEKFKEID